MFTMRLYDIYKVESAFVNYVLHHGVHYQYFPLLTSLP